MGTKTVENPNQAATAANNSGYIRIESVRKSFDSLQVLKGIDLAIERGRTIALVGPSGSGKSVLVSMLVGLLRPDSGAIWVAGQEVTGFQGEKKWDRLRRRIGFLFQGSALFDSMNVGANISFTLRQLTELSPDDIRNRVGETLEMVGLVGIERKMPAELSGGMQKRVALARCIAHEPEIVIYDEPTTGLDPIRTDSIAQLIRKLQGQMETTSIVVTHDMHCAYAVADRMVLLHNGRLIAKGTAEEFRTSSDPHVHQFVTGNSEGPME